MASISSYEEGLDGAVALALRHKALQRTERRHRRETERAQLLLSSSKDDAKSCRDADCQAQELDLLQQITTRQGFIAQQLKSQTLRPLERWYHQLQLMQLETQDLQPVDRDDDEEDHVTALMKLEQVLSQDVSCFDLQYASRTKKQDAWTSLLDSTQSQSPPEEILSFSTMKSGRVIRITCLGTSASATGQQHDFQSSLLVQDFGSRAAQLLLETRDAHSLIDLLWSEPAP